MMHKKQRPTLSKKWIPRAYQKAAIRFLVSRPHAALLADPGLGKTGCALTAYLKTRDAGLCKSALIIAPKRVCQCVWTHEEGGELHKWNESFGHLSLTFLHGAKKDALLDEKTDLYVINYDGLRWLVDSGGFKHLIKSRGVDYLIVDELSKFSASNTKRFKMMRPLFGIIPHRKGYTGSPAPNGLIKLFGQMFVIDLGRSLGQYVTHYRSKYFFPSGYGGYDWKLQPGAEKKIYSAVKKIALAQRAEDHLDLPRLVVNNIWLNLPAKVRKHYNDVERDYLTAVEDEVVVAANAAVASGKCRQIASGGIYAEDASGAKRSLKGARKVIQLHDEKTKALKELVGELQGAPLLVAYEFHHDLERIRKEFGKRIPAINGQTTDKQLQRIVKAWNIGAIPMLCGHPASMGHGLNLQAACSHICWYSLTWDFELYDQTVRRIYRQGVNAQRVVVHRILARDTVDEDVVKALEAKKRKQDALFEALKARVRKRLGT